MVRACCPSSPHCAAAETVNERGRLILGLRRYGNGRRPRIRDIGRAWALPVVFTQSDVRNVQLAKSAIRTGLDLLLAQAGIDAARSRQTYVAGAFGKFLDVEDAVLIGLLPDLPRPKISQVGNAAGAGVRRLVACAKPGARCCSGPPGTLP